MNGKRSLFLVPAFFIFPLFLFAQHPFPEKGPVFVDDAVPRIDILIPPASLAEILGPENAFSDELWPATFFFDNGSLRDTVENIGFRLRGGQFSRTARKKSFKVSFNTFEPGRKWQGLEKMNLNGEHNDPTISRARICWDLLREMKVPAPRANHVRLYINGEYYGLYANVEHIDEEFAGLRFGDKDGNLYKCLWPADLAYLGDNPNLYKLLNGSRRVYELTNNEEQDDYSDLAHFIDVLNNAPADNFACELEQVFNVDAYLRVIAFDVLSGNWDGPLYNKNNFYLYHNESTGLMEYIPYDLDNTLGVDYLGVDWGVHDIYSWAHPFEPRPLYNRILAVPEYRSRYSYYLGRFVEEIFNEGHLYPRFNALRSLIAPFVQNDPFHSLDYGFGYSHFLAGFDGPLPWAHTPYGLRDFVTTRRNSALGQLEINDISPIIRAIAHNAPSEAQDISITAEVEDDGGPAAVEACYRLNGQGGYQCLAMSDDGLHADGAAGDGRYGAILPALNEQAVLEYYISAVDGLGQESRSPLCGDNSIFVGSSSVPLAVNEIMPSNSSVIADEAGQYDDWLEVYNYGGSPVYLGDRFLSDDEGNPTRWQFPDIWIQAGEFLLVWADDDENQGPLHTNFKLDADGEFIGIFDNTDNNHALIDGISFSLLAEDQAWGRLPNGTGPFQAVLPTPGASNQPLSAVEEKEAPGWAWQVFPNPFGEMLQVRFEAGAPENGRLALRDALGKTLVEMPVGKGRKDVLLPAGKLPAGLYFLAFETDGGRGQVKKIARL